MIVADRFNNRTVIVSGGGAGIGAAIARRFMAEGARVGVIDLDTSGLVEGLDEAVVERLLAVDADCTDEHALTEFHGRVVSGFGPVDILINNVGQSGRERSAPFHESNEEVWRFVLEISLISAMRLSRLAAPAMRERGGRIVNMASDAAFAGDAGLADYAAAKMGLIGFTRSLARELAPHGVTVNAVAPGAIRTRAHERVPAAVIERIKAETPAGFVGEPDDVAAAVAFLASDEARFITGQSLLIDGGRWMI
ncbi:short-chain dehydrogenase [Mesorhizobium sp. L-8-10]|uniref:SDR family NAD(P)-dependent oxidoreductase n=1 Tax=Mesorhizobium sp. L-8-10 TaxID=2744523 RepID=UPI001928FC77|nr:SDR family NAD(P)-dependent oxidoreductase [Mesorhizobium sp. L-8-10]BCH29114.1 short-chain dehydrogenase [Mesorhizobium sp. L-8-10]